MSNTWGRRSWLVHQVQTAAALVVVSHPSTVLRSFGIGVGHSRVAREGELAARLAAHAERVDPGPLHALALQAVEAAMRAGAQYADARLTRVVTQLYSMADSGRILFDTDEVGVGVRALVNGYWGFSASPFWEAEEVVRLARDAVAQATEFAKGPSRSVELGSPPVVTGTWTTPIQIDPFAIPIEEKFDAILYWKHAASQAGLSFVWNGALSDLMFARQERVVATSEGSLFTQTLYETGGTMLLYNPNYVAQKGLGQLFGFGDVGPTVSVRGIDLAAKGWELFLDATIPDQFPRLKEETDRMVAVGEKSGHIGRFTLVCDGATMANMVASTLGPATQLDRALGYEADARGTSFVNDPLAMAGTFQVASPVVTLTANRSLPTQLATVQWDDEGVTPKDFPLVKDGRLVDFQTTREQATWLAPYYHRQGTPVQSHGCAAAEDAHMIPMQHMPNLSLEPGAVAIRLEDLVADVKEGILVEGGQTGQVDFQAKNGLLFGAMREIKNGRLGPSVSDIAVLFNTMHFWNRVHLLGGSATHMTVGKSQYFQDGDRKGQPEQRTSYSVQAVAATITDQPFINPQRKA